MRRPLWVGAVVLTIIATIFVLASGRPATSPSPDVVLDEPGVVQQPGISTNAPLLGTMLEHADVVDLQGQSASTAQWFADDPRPVLVNFWFTTCPPCRREMPALQAAHEAYADRVRFIGVNVQDSASTIQSFLEELGVTYEMVRDFNGALVVANGVAAFPTTLFIDTDGRIVEQVAGELTPESIERAIGELLDGPST